MDELLARLEKLEYHQKLLLEMIDPNDFKFNWMIINKNLCEDEVKELHQLCEQLSKDMEKQRAEGFVFCAPLFQQFVNELNNKLKPHEVIQACLQQKLYPDLMSMLKQNL